MEVSSLYYAVLMIIIMNILSHSYMLVSKNLIIEEVN